jgi:hypothetical protein
MPSQAHRCELLTADAQLWGYRRCGRRGAPSVADGLVYRVACPRIGPRWPGSGPPGWQSGCAGPTGRR